MNQSFSPLQALLPSILNKGHKENVDSSNCKGRWTYIKPHAVQYQESHERIPKQIFQKALKKIKFFLIDNESLKGDLTIEDKDKLKELKKLISFKVLKYQNSHGFLYQKCMKLFFGNIEKIQNEINKTIHDLLYSKEIHQLASEAKEIQKLIQNHSSKGDYPFELIEQLKTNKSKVKQLINEIKEQGIVEPQDLTDIINFYEDFQSAHQLFQFLHLLKEGIKSSQLTDEQKSFLHLLKLINEGSDIKELAKDKKKWKMLRQHLWQGSLETHDLPSEKRSFKWISGSQSSTVQSVINIKNTTIAQGKSALVPTGILVKHDITPLSGELGTGINKTGINLSHLSGMLFTGLSTCLGYANQKAFQFNPHKELQVLSQLSPTYTYTLDQLYDSIMDLLMNGHQVNKEFINYLQEMREKLTIEPTEKSNDWQIYGSLIGEVLSYEKVDLINPKQLKRGQIVCIQRYNIKGKPYYVPGIIKESLKNDLHEVIISKEGITERYTSSQLFAFDQANADSFQEPFLFNEDLLLTRAEKLDFLIKLANVSHQSHGKISKKDGDISSSLKIIENFKEIYDVNLVRIKIAVLRLLMMGYTVDDVLLNPIKEMQQTLKDIPLESDDWKTHPQLIGREVVNHYKSSTSKLTDLKRGQIVKVKNHRNKYIYGIVKEPSIAKDTYNIVVDQYGTYWSYSLTEVEAIDPNDLQEVATKIEPYQDSINNLKKHLQTEAEQVAEILDLPNHIQPLNFDEITQKAINNPFPIVWASCTLNPIKFKHGVKNECVVQGIARLEDDIQVVFTSKEHVNELQSMLKDYQVQVLSFEAAVSLMIENQQIPVING